jgi:predicted small integral membrane protein
MKLIKIFLASAVGVMLLLAAVNNVIMYQGGIGVVGGAAGMETTFQDPLAMWRAISSPALIWVLFASIVVGELVAGLVCARGALSMWLGRDNPDAYEAGKRQATIGLGIAAAMYSWVFLTVANEWFMMWQSQDINVLPSALQHFTVASLTMVWLKLADD